MRKLLLLTILFLSVLNTNIFAQVCGSGAIQRWTGTSQIGDHQAPIPFNVNGDVTDWRTYITGPLNSAYTNSTTPQPNPYLMPLAGANIQNDGLSGIDDQDNPQSNARDLRFFAFTYDQKNIYFYYRRPASDNTQVSLYYFIDVNADGYMKTGEPVVILTISNSGSLAEIKMGQYVEGDYLNTQFLNTNGSPYKINQSLIHTSSGDLMVAPANFGPNRVSGRDYYWRQSYADGYNLPGRVILLNTQPTPGVGELFAAKTTENGFGAEFVIPWRFLKNYNTNTPPLTYSKVFIWHVALQNGGIGNSGTDAYEFQDNAGGCCGGAAVSGTANIEAQTPVITPNGPFTKYRLIVPYHEQAGANTDVQLRHVSFTSIKTGLNNSEIDPSSFLLNVAPDGNQDGTPDGPATNYIYNSSQTAYEPITIDQPAQLTLNQNGDGQFIVDIDLVHQSITSVKVDFKATAQIVITNDCEVSSEDIELSSTTIQVIPLPVHFQSFNATRNKDKKEQVVLKWVTATEQNNRGFNVQKKVNGQWKNIAFVFSQAENGNSNTALSYEYKDANVSNTVTQYQIQQVDYDGKTSYSDIRSVVGMEQKKSVVTYPNPGVDGKVNLLFSEVGSVKQVIVSDMNGRIVKEYRQVTDNNLTIDGLKSGFYTIKITDRATATTTVEKVIIR